MKIEESIWIANNILKLAKPGQKLLNIGSSTGRFRNQIQPHITKNIFKPIEKNGIAVIHTDIQNSAGVDLVGDLLDEEFVKVLEREQFDFILCSNLLEHLEEIEPICRIIERILKKNGYAIITVPYNYPYHLDPIDNMFRPTVKELAENFSTLKNLNGEILEAKSYNSKLNTTENNYFQKLKNNPKMLLLILIRSLLPFYKFSVWKKTIFGVLRLFRPFSVTCLVLKK